jgi:hypothetical protein
VEWYGHVFKHYTSQSITNPGEDKDVIAVAYVATRAKVKDDDNIIP